MHAIDFLRQLDKELHRINPKPDFHAHVVEKATWRPHSYNGEMSNDDAARLLNLLESTDQFAIQRSQESWTGVTRYSHENEADAKKRIEMEEKKRVVYSVLTNGMAKTIQEILRFKEVQLPEQIRLRFATYESSVKNRKLYTGITGEKVQMKLGEYAESVEYEPYPWVEEAKERVAKNSRVSAETLRTPFDF